MRPLYYKSIYSYPENAGKSNGKRSVLSRLFKTLYILHECGIWAQHVEHCRFVIIYRRSFASLSFVIVSMLRRGPEFVLNVNWQKY